MTPVRWRIPLLVLAGSLLVLAGSGALFRPVCVPMGPDDLAQFNTPIETRVDRDFYLKVFQQRNGQWFQCKTWVSRQFFF